MSKLEIVRGFHEQNLRGLELANRAIHCDMLLSATLLVSCVGLLLISH